MVEVSITIDTSEVEQALTQLEIGLSVAEPVIASQVAHEAYDIIKRWCPSPSSEFYMTNSTGFLRDSHELIPVDATTWRIKPMARYAFWVHMGHRMVPHGLVGVSIGKGHPPRGAVPWVQPRPWISDAVGYMKPHMNEIVSSAIRSLVSSG